MSDDKSGVPDWFASAMLDSEEWFAPGDWQVSAEKLWPKICERMRSVATTWDPVGGRPVNQDLAASATQDDRPSIAELQRQSANDHDGGHGCAMLSAAPVLLEIAATAQAYASAPIGRVVSTWTALLSALAKVRP